MAKLIFISFATLFFCKLSQSEDRLKYYAPAAYNSIDLNANTIENSENLSYPSNSSDLAEIDRKYASCWKIKDIRELTIKQVHYYYKTKKLSVFQLTSCYLRRIEKMNPFLNAVIETNPDAIRLALKLDYERFLGYEPKYEGLYGIPILIKDNIATVDYMQTCSGSLALVGYKPLHAAKIVKQLLQAKVIILGKSNLSEFANFRGFNIPNGWSVRGGQTRNPYSLQVDPQGSSTGSAVATGANLCMAAVGTETDGSIVAPAEKACVCGLKTSHECDVSIKGIIPISAFTQDTAGPFTRTIEDMMTFMSIFFPKEYDDDYGRLSLYEQCQKPGKKFRIGIFRTPFWERNLNDTLQRQTIQEVEKTLNIFKKSRYIKLVDPVKAPKKVIEEVTGDKAIITMNHEFKYAFNKYLEQVHFVGNKDYPYSQQYSEPDPYSQQYSEPDPYSQQYSEPDRKPLTLKDVIQYNKDHPVPEGYQQEKLVEAEKTDGIFNATYLKARNENVRNARYLFDSILEYYKLDAIAAPIITAWFDTDEASLYSYAAIAGYPYIVVPAGFINTFNPVGLIFHGPLCSEKTLMCIAKIYEEKVLARRPPTFAP